MIVSGQTKMVNLSYNLSANIQDSLKKVESLRIKILTVPLSRETELKIRWNKTINKIYWSLVLENTEVKKQNIEKVLSNSSPKKLEKQEKEVLRYKKALDYIAQDWLAADRSITSRTITNLHDICSDGRLVTSENSIKEITNYIGTSNEHPVLEAAILQIALLSLSPFSKGNGKTARLSTYLSLYRKGYDFKGFLCVDERLAKDEVIYKEYVEKVKGGGNITLWLEYFTNILVEELEKVLTDILAEKYNSSSSLGRSFFELNDRQKEILSILDQPQVTISNKKVQNLFKISQITASRDLSRLSALGLIYPHGKGRSVYYSRV